MCMRNRAKSCQNPTFSYPRQDGKQHVILCAYTLHSTLMQSHNEIQGLGSGSMKLAERKQRLLVSEIVMRSYWEQRENKRKFLDLPIFLALKSGIKATAAQA